MVGARVDVVVVGAGIAGSALASKLARSGVSVLVLEQSTAYKDKVRGETVMPWGVLECDRMELTETLLDAGGEFAPEFVSYDELRTPAQAEAAPVPLSVLVPGAAGTLNVGHPEASEALSRKAAEDGADVRRGVQDVKVSFGSSPSVAYADAEGVGHEVSTRLVVGADGRTSTVRRQAGLALEERPAVIFGAGLLVRCDSGFTQQNTLGTEGDAMFLAFPRRDDLTRLYLMVDIARQKEFTGPHRLDRFLDVYRRLSAFPAGPRLGAGEAAGPAGGAPMTDSWTTEDPVVAGSVLIGDAAGWNDPIIGQGLSIAFRDARSVADVLLASEDWSPAAFSPWVAERRERMRRLAIHARLTTELRCTFTDAGRERRSRWFAAFFSDPIVLGQVVGTLAGPETVAAEAYSDDAVAATLAI